MTNNNFDKAVSRSGRPGMEQDKAVGGENLRKARIKSGDIVTISLSLTETLKGNTSVMLRFKTGSSTIQRQVGSVMAPTRFEALKLAWKLIRDEKIVGKEGWSWVEPSSQPN